MCWPLAEAISFRILIFVTTLVAPERRVVVRVIGDMFGDFVELSSLATRSAGPFDDYNSKSFDGVRRSFQESEEQF